MPKAELVADVTAGPGGVMTDEVGVITGVLTLRTELNNGSALLRVRYKDAEEWYTITDSKVPLKNPADLAALHHLAVALINRPEEG
jgi:hypothetical protein